MLMPPADPTCARCGYKLRGINSDRCPECGHAREWTTVRMHDTIQFLQAIDVLKDAGIDFRSSSTTSGIEGIVGTTKGGPIEGGSIRYPRAEADRIYDLMHDAGLPIGPPLVDRHDPECPACGMDIRPVDVNRCPHCETRVQWIDIDESATPFSETCLACGYNLNHLMTGRCPGNVVKKRLATLNDSTPKPSRKRSRRTNPGRTPNQSSPIPCPQLQPHPW